MITCNFVIVGQLNLPHYDRNCYCKRKKDWWCRDRC